MTAPTLPPPLPVDDLRFSAKLDYITVTNEGKRIKLPALRGSPKWTRPDRHKADWHLTIHDPTAGDLRAITSAYENPTVMAIEVAVDVTPKALHEPTEHDELLKTVFAAVAARFRPEEKALWDYGKRFAVSGKGKKPEPLERRFARPTEEVVYGHRGGWMQAKLYLKTLDDGALLPLHEQAVRMEVTLRRWACMVFGLNNLNDLFGYPYRSKLATQFRIIDRPEVRLARGLTDEDIARRTNRMNLAWRTAGVAKFALGEAPRADKLEKEITRVRARERAQLPADQFKLLRDQKANAKIGAALVGLQRRMKTP